MAQSNLESTAKHAIYQTLRRSIILGRRAPGTRLNVEELSEEYGTSITPVRDALQMLSQESLVTIQPRSGYFVTRVTLKELRDLLDLREILESAAVERAALRITDEELDALEHVHAGYTGDDDFSYDRYTEENRRFHCLIAQASGNQELTESVGHLHDRLARFMVLRRAGKTMEYTHARIIKALRAHDPTLARQAMVDEIRDAASLILDRVIQTEGSAWELGGVAQPGI
ncbi:MAG: GntR family transcriptional regulator [Anaerolineae bacterium]|nr:GntR family transcriptional regulator [Anaerolineae bacterium]